MVPLFKNSLSLDSSKILAFPLTDILQAADASWFQHSGWLISYVRPAQDTQTREFSLQRPGRTGRLARDPAPAREFPRHALPATVKTRRGRRPGHTAKRFLKAYSMEHRPFPNLSGGHATGAGPGGSEQIGTILPLKKNLKKGVLKPLNFFQPRILLFFPSEIYLTLVNRSAFNLGKIFFRTRSATWVERGRRCRRTNLFHQRGDRRLSPVDP